MSTFPDTNACVEASAQVWEALGGLCLRRRPPRLQQLSASRLFAFLHLTRAQTGLFTCSARTHPAPLTPPPSPTVGGSLGHREVASISNAFFFVFFFFLLTIRAEATTSSSNSNKRGSVSSCTQPQTAPDGAARSFSFSHPKHHRHQQLCVCLFVSPLIGGLFFFKHLRLFLTLGPSRSHLGAPGGAPGFTAGHPPKRVNTGFYRPSLVASFVSNKSHHRGVNTQ